MHATVAPHEMLAIDAFDHVVQGPGGDDPRPGQGFPAAYPRLVQGVGAKSMAEWPMMDREL